ncbi:pyridoxamine 5'-phosphate oxidase family protein [Streptomyces malaysiensis]|uniref:TIGR03618 family F420-dependent PPOX class oxidoreductase n=1 Tax=Streptomyces malaysiensis subsp. samsunensis TaxID=459658 RepID=A0A9X2LZP3_STRMQ|nr:TIGR03618 family F420-dependent PPOX class oxidoreductase [Streptomyces samsunensis]MCQ8832642.1 TIGR03618 family F420-dependent PPOX class oxidoreductase [Streptomyces samsunensis]
MTTTENKSPANGAETKPGAGPAPRVLTEDELSRTLRDQRFGVLATVKRGGHPHLSTVIHRWSPEERVLRISSTADRLKVRQLRRDPHAAVHVGAPDGWSFAVAEGEAEVSEVTAVPGDAVGRELLSMTPGFAEPHEEAAFLEQLVADRRVVIRIRVSRLYGTALDMPAG